MAWGFRVQDFGAYDVAVVPSPEMRVPQDLGPRSLRSSGSCKGSGFRVLES